MPMRAVLILYQSTLHASVFRDICTGPGLRNLYRQTEPTRPIVVIAIRVDRLKGNFEL
jgi:hypothetical protein